MNLENFNNNMSPALFVRALYDFNSKDNSSLSFKKNDIIQVLTQLESGWWDGLCNGERGWFPSNYVTVEDEILDYNESDWIPHHTSDGEIFYYNIKTGESSWDVPADSNYDDDDDESLVTTHTARDTSPLSRQLPENWIQKPTDDGNTYYYYNVITKEIRWTYPGNSISTDISSDIEEELNVTDLVKGDLEGADNADKASIASSKGSQLSTASIDTIRQRSLQQRQSIDNLPPNWVVKTTSQGTVYYYNKSTNEISWSLDNIDANGRLIRAENHKRSGSDDEVPNEPLPPTPTVSIPHTPKRLSEPLILMLQNANENLTWDSLLQSIDSSVHNLSLAVQDNMSQDYPDYTNAIVVSVRIMFYASGTVEKDSVAIKQNKNLKLYHRHIMASLSKLVLSTKVAASVWPPLDGAQKMKSDADEVLDAVHRFIQIARQIVDIRRVDPKVIESATGGSWRGNNLIQIQSDDNKSTSSSINPEDNASNSYLTLDLINLLDKNSRTVTQSILLLLNFVKKVIDNPNSSIPGSFSPQLVSQTKEVLTQVGQFLSIIEDINLKDLDESATINEFNIVKQALYNNIAGLVICIQTATDPLSPLDAMDQILIRANVVDKSVKDVITTTKSLVGRMRSRRPSITNPLDQVNEDDSKGFEGNQSTTSSSEITNPPASKPLNNSNNLLPVPENKIMNYVLMAQGPINLAGSKKDDLPVSPKSTTKLRLPSISSADSSPTVVSGGNTGGSPVASEGNTGGTLIANGSNTGGSSVASEGEGNTKSRASKVTKFFGEDVATKQKEDKPWFLNYDYDPSEMVFNMESSVKGGTLNALIERLTMHDLLDTNVIATFLLTYRSFCSTDEFFDMLVKRFKIQPPKNLSGRELEIWQEKKQTPIRLRVFNIMKTWLEFYYMDDEDSHCLEKMKEFASTTMHEGMAFAATSLTKVIEKRQQQRKDAKFKELVVTNSLAPPPSILPKNIKKLKFLDIDPLEIARQLTIMESKLYNKIKPVECLGKAWSQSEGDNVAVNIKAMIVNSNKITGWVAESILSQKEIRKRCMYIKHFVAVADKCRGLNNFNSLTAITSGLYSAPIHRLRRTWEMVNARTAQTLETLSGIMTSTKNFAGYREMLHSINPPCVPFFGLYLTDLTFIEDGNPDYLKNSSQLINFSKRMKTADVIREIQQYQSVPYNLKPVQEIQMFIKCHLQDSRDVKDLYDQSLSLEPREREDEKIARLLQESGFL